MKVIKDYVIFEGGWEGVGEIRELILISRRPLETGLQIKKKKTSGTNFIKFEFFFKKRKNEQTDLRDFLCWGEFRVWLRMCVYYAND